MFPVATGKSFMVQQTVSGTGTFNGSDYGRAKALRVDPVTSPNADLFFAAKLYGAAANAVTVSLLDQGPGVTVTGTTVAMVGNAMQVTLRRSSGALLATATEVANAINAFALSPIRAKAGGNGTGIVQPTGAPVALNATASGVDASVDAGVAEYQEIFKWVPPSNTHAGLFYFEQEQVLIVRQFEAKFTIASGTHVVEVQRVNLDAALEPITSEAIPFYVHDQLTTARPDIAVSDVRIVLHPLQAVRVVTYPVGGGAGLQGLVRLDVRREANFPYL